MDVRKVINAELKRQDRSRYWLATHDGVSCSGETIYRYLRGQRDLSSKYVGQVLAVLGLVISRKLAIKRPKARPKPRK